MQGFGHSENRGRQCRRSAGVRGACDDVRLRGAHRWQEADGDYQRDARERQVPERTQAAPECGECCSLVANQWGGLM